MLDTASRHVARPKNYMYQKRPIKQSPRTLRTQQHLQKEIKARGFKIRANKAIKARGFKICGKKVIKVGLGILQITSAKRCPQVWPWFGRSLFSTNFVEFDQAV